MEVWDQNAPLANKHNRLWAISKTESGEQLAAVLDFQLETLPFIATIT